MTIFETRLLDNIIDSILVNNINDVLELVEKLHIEEEFYSFQFMYITIKSQYNHIFKYLLEESRKSSFMENTYSGSQMYDKLYDGRSIRDSYGYNIWNPTNKGRIYQDSSTDNNIYFKQEGDGYYLVNEWGDVITVEQAELYTSKANKAKNSYESIFSLFHTAIEYNNPEALSMIIKDDRITTIPDMELKKNYYYLESDRYELFRILMCSNKVDKKFKKNILNSIINDIEGKFNDQIKTIIDDKRFFNSKNFSLSQTTLNKLLISTFESNNHDIFEFLYNKDIFYKKTDSLKLLYYMCRYNGYKSYNYFIEKNKWLLENTEYIDDCIDISIHDGSYEMLDYMLGVKNTSYDDGLILEEILNKSKYDLFTNLSSSDNIDIFMSSKLYFRNVLLLNKLSRGEIAYILKNKPLPVSYENYHIVNEAAIHDDYDLFASVVDNKSFDDRSHRSKQFKNIIVNNLDFVEYVAEKYPNFSLMGVKNLYYKLANKSELLSYTLEKELIPFDIKGDVLVDKLLDYPTQYKGGNVEAIIKIMKRKDSSINIKTLNRIIKMVNEEEFNEELSHRLKQLVRKKKIEKII